MDVELLDDNSPKYDLEPNLSSRNTDEFVTLSSSNTSNVDSRECSDHVGTNTSNDVEKIASIDSKEITCESSDHVGIDVSNDVEKIVGADYMEIACESPSIETVVVNGSSDLNVNIERYLNSEAPIDCENCSTLDSEHKVSDEIDLCGSGENNVDECSSHIDSTFEIEYNFKQIPFQITGSWKEFSSRIRSLTKQNFTRGCKWAPDGSCILTCSNDNILKIFNLPHQLWDTSQWNDISEMEAAVKISEGELIYDYCWYPRMNSSDISTCCLASASKNSPAHLWDGFTGELRCSYRAYDQMDEIVTPHSLSFDADGQKLFCGFEKVIRIFNVDLPGRNFEERRIFAKKSGQSGIVSAFAFTPANRNISVVGSYSKTIGIYSEPSGELECLLEGQKGGITQLHFSPDGMLLYSGGRKDSEILCWDLRNLGTVLFALRRSNVTNQRMYFDISRCGKYVVSGNNNGVISIWDTTKQPKSINENEFEVLEPIQFFLAHEDCVNGVSLHPTFPLLCSSSGQRKFPSLLPEDDEEIFAKDIDKWDNSLRLWWIGK